MPEMPFHNKIIKEDEAALKINRSLSVATCVNHKVMF